MTQPLFFQTPVAGAKAVMATPGHQDQADQRQTQAVAILVATILVVAGSAQMGLLWTAGVIVSTVGAVVTLMHQRASSRFSRRG